MKKRHGTPKPRPQPPPFRICPGAAEDRIEEKLDHEIDALVDLRNRIEAAVEKLEDGKLRVFMEYKYIGGMTNEEAAMEMNYSSRQGDRFHAKALALIDLS